MASTKLAFLAAVVLLLQASSSAVARHHHEPEDPCRDGASSGLLRHKGHRCSSPAVSPKGGGTPAVMTVNGFERGQDGGGAAECDGHFHSNHEMIAALSTGWYAGGRRCHKPIRITSAHNGRSVVARVVDECDSRHGCKDNIVDTSKAVWDALGLDTNVGVVPVTWSDV
ncbi:putative ripening-related protein 6 [Dichanthelium oligosanthes]|uniref:Putative ripening-related protein 6 n=1 Tax=Dichanthelium oligosanthes TaxID=888268 RepID=A0A1E5UW38_9POAL|nr:putative ripening-related protein 6 [Dichanthelium oligosanthes]